MTTEVGLVIKKGPLVKKIGVEVQNMISWLPLFISAFLVQNLGVIRAVVAPLFFEFL